MQKTKPENDQTLPPPVSCSDRSPLIIVCEQTGQQRVQMKMDELFNSSPKFILDEPISFKSDETLELKKTTTKQSSRKRRIRTNSAAGRSRRLESEQTQKTRRVSTKINPFSSQTLKLALVAILASFFRA